MSEFSLSFDYKIIGAYCGHTYAVPRWVVDYTCPMCASQLIRDVTQERDQTNVKLSRLRGVITRLKRRKP